MKFLSVNEQLPKPGVEVLVRGWGEKKAHYIYELAEYVLTRTGSRWESSSDNGYELWFAPIEWAELEQPNAQVNRPQKAAQGCKDE